MDSLSLSNSRSLKRRDGEEERQIDTHTHTKECFYRLRGSHDGYAMPVNRFFCCCSLSCPVLYQDFYLYLFAFPDCFLLLEVLCMFHLNLRDSDQQQYSTRFGITAMPPIAVVVMVLLPFSLSLSLCLNSYSYSINYPKPTFLFLT